MNNQIYVPTWGEIASLIGTLSLILTAPLAIVILLTKKREKTKMNVEAKNGL